MLEISEEQPEPREGIRYQVISILYIIQATLLRLTQNLILTYRLIPSYSVLSLFELAKVAFQLKFILAPFIQKYTSVEYGTRKTWVMGGNLSMAFFCFLLSYYSTDQTIMVAIALVFFMCTSIAIQDISLDALSIKQIGSPKTAGFVQTASLSLGQVIGTIIFFRLISRDFGIKLGLQTKIMEVATFIKILAISIFIFTLYLHFSYKQPQLESQTEVMNRDKTLLETFKIYRIFFKTQRKQFRLSVLLLVMNQGLMFYCYTYQTQLFRKGFPRSTIKEIENYSLIPSIICCYYLNKLSLDSFTLLKVMMWVRSTVLLLGFIFDPQTYYPVFVYVFIQYLVTNAAFLSQITSINSIRLNRYSAMIICMLNSMRNTGDSNFIHLWIIGKIGFQAGCYIGFTLQCVIAICIGRIIEWVNQGNEDEFQVE